MEVWLDGTPLEGEVAGENLQELLEGLMAARLGDDRTLREVKVNGRPFEAADLGPAQHVGRGQIQRLDVETVSAREVALHFLANSDGYLRAIAASIERVAELFRVGDEASASGHYLNTLESLQLFMQVLQTSRDTLGLNFAQMGPGNQSVDRLLIKLQRLIQELLVAQEQEDWVLLADLLQYDLSEEINRWLGMVPALKEKALS